MTSPLRVVLLVHGIRTTAAWAEMVQAELQQSADIIVIPVRYGYLDLASFLLPGPTRIKPVRRIAREIRAARTTFEGASISVLAHSFGTYAITRILAEEGDITLDRLVLCGGIVREDYHWDLVRSRVTERPVNDCGSEDVWPLLASSMTWGYGASGVFGFGSVGVRDRFHPARHSDYFDREFVRRYWRPYFVSGTVQPSDWDKTRPADPSWKPVLAKAPLRWLLVGLVALVLFTAARPFILQLSSLGASARAQREYEQALDLLKSEAPNDRVAAVQHLVNAARDVPAYHWAMLEQLPTSIRNWTGAAVSENPCKVDNSPGFLTAERARAPANAVEVRAALQALSTRDLRYEAPSKLPDRVKGLDVSHDSDSSGAPATRKQSLAMQHQTIVKWRGDTARASYELLGPMGTEFPSIRAKPWLSLANSNLTFAQLDGLNLQGVDLSGSRMCGVRLQRSVLDKADLSGTKADAAWFYEASLKEANLEGASVVFTNLGKADLRGAWMPRVNLSRSNLWRAKLGGAIAPGAHLDSLETLGGANVEGAILWRATLVNARVGNLAHWEGGILGPALPADSNTVNLRGVSLRAADLRCAFMGKVDLTNADLTDARLDSTTFVSVDLRRTLGLTAVQLRQARVDTSVILSAALADSISRKALPHGDMPTCHGS